jgi:hypothetical protein
MPGAQSKKAGLATGLFLFWSIRNRHTPLSWKSVARQRSRPACGSLPAIGASQTDPDGLKTVSFAPSGLAKEASSLREKIWIGRIAGKRRARGRGYVGSGLYPLQRNRHLYITTVDGIGFIHRDPRNEIFQHRLIRR